MSAWGSRADDEKLRPQLAVGRENIIIADGPSRAAHAAHEGRSRIHFNFFMYEAASESKVDTLWLKDR